MAVGGGQVSGVGWQVPDDIGLLRVVCNPFRVGAHVGEVPVAARGLPPAIFCQPCGLKLGPSPYWGETGAIHLSVLQMLHKRPNNHFEDLKDVYLVGGGAHPGSGFPSSTSPHELPAS